MWDCSSVAGRRTVGEAVGPGWPEAVRDRSVRSLWCLLRGRELVEQAEGALGGSDGGRGVHVPVALLEGVLGFGEGFGVAAVLEGEGVGAADEAVGAEVPDDRVDGGAGSSCPDRPSPRSPAASPSPGSPIVLRKAPLQLAPQLIHAGTPFLVGERSHVRAIGAVRYACGD